MKKSKHFRKDVIIARIIFAMLCILVGILVGSGISALTKLVGKDEDVQKPNTFHYSCLENSMDGGA